MNRPYTICVIDDDDIYQFTIKRTIQSTNLAKEILSFNDAEEALEYFGTLTEVTDSLPDILFVDINMPLMNGWEFLEAFQTIKYKFQKDIKIFMSSSSIDSRDMEKAQEYECVSDYLIKPMTIDKLKDILQS